MINENKKIYISSLGLLGAFAVFAFSVMRYIDGAIFMAAFDGILGIVFLAITVYTYITGSDTLGRYAISLVAMAGSILTTLFNADTGPYWVYVTIIVLFYLLPYRHASLLSIVIVVVLFLLLYESSVYSQLVHFLATIALISMFSFLFGLNIERTAEKLRTLSMQDDLTNTGNRRAFVQKLTEAVNLFKRFGFKASLIYVDIDHYKSINDRFGHTLGDKALVAICDVLVSSLRETDKIFRIGGDEFVIVVEGGGQ